MNDTSSESPRAVVFGTSTGPNGTGDRSDEIVAEPVTQVGESAKLMRIGTMIKQLLAEVHERSLREVEDGLSPRAR